MTVIRHIGFLICLCALTAQADVAYYESEPNNTPEEFNQISGEITLYGEMTGQDQDGFLWTVSDDDSRKAWTFELHGIASAKLTQVSVMQLEYAENGVDVVGRTTLFSMGTRDSTRPSIHRGLIFEPGEYVLGIVQSGAGDEDSAYRFFIREETLKVYKNPAGGATLDDAHAIRPGNLYTSFEPGETAWYRFNFDEADAANRWAISVRVPVGKKLEAGLYDASGEELISRRADKKGRISFKDLAPPVGTWFLKLETRQPGMIQDVTTEITGISVAGQEAEPNDERKLANVVDLGQPLTGRIGDDDSKDLFRFTVEESETPSLQTLRLESDSPQKLNFCLTDANWKSVQCRSEAPPLTMSDLLLPPGEWGIELSRSNPQNYTITLETQGPVDPDREVEPNDQLKYATGVPSKMRVKGSFSGDDTDYYQFYVAGEAQLWRFQVNGPGISSIGYVDGRGREKTSVKASSGQQRLRLDNVFLLPGRHAIRVRGEDGEYTLLARALGPPVATTDNQSEDSADPDGSTKATSAAWNPDGEVEPNDKRNMQRLAVGQVRTGTLPDDVDYDYYRFFVANYDHLALTIEPPDDGSITAYLSWYNTDLGAFDARNPGEKMVFQGLLPPGDYHLALRAVDVSDKPYRLKLERRPRFDCPKDCEPNGMKNFDFAAPLPRDLVLEGIVGEWRDSDVYQLPAFTEEVELIIRSDDAKYGIRLIGPDGSSSRTQRHDSDLGGYRVVIPAGEAHRLLISGKNYRYRLPLEFSAGLEAQSPGKLEASVALALETTKVAAFSDLGQRLSGNLQIANPGAQPVDIELEATTSDHRWSVELSRDKVTVPSGQELSIPLTVSVPADAWADHTVRVSILAANELGRRVESWADIEVSRTTGAVNPELYWPIPPQLRGGFNSAWSPFGAEWTDDTPERVRRSELRDDLVFPDHKTWCCGTGRDAPPMMWTLDLPGDDPVPVRGIAFETFGNPSAYRGIAQATLLLSMDGTDFTEALSINALPVLTEQHFEMPEALPARYARMRVDRTFEVPAKEVGVGEWKVILEPGHDLSAGQGFNVADPDHGGHLVWALPPHSRAGHMLDDDHKSQWSVLDKDKKTEFVIGFKRNRAAQIQRIEWNYDDSVTEQYRNFRSVRVLVSEHSPVGPWQTVGTMALEASDTSVTLDLESPTWARFVRFEAQMDPDSKNSKDPALIRIWERPGGEDYLSVLTEWGEAGGRAFYESLQAIPETSNVASENESRATAALLDIGERTAGTVALGRVQNWYRVSVPADINLLSLELTGDPTVRTVLSAENEAGEKIPVTELRSGRSPGRHRYEAVVEPGKDIWINVLEPPRNVVFSWDTSGSVGAYVDRIYNAVMAFSGEVEPGYEWVNLQPFNMPMLLREWSDDPLVLQTVLNDYRQEVDSSAAEESLYKASRALARRPGTKAIVLVTDAISPYFGRMWIPMAEIQPRIFGVGVGGAGIEEQNRFRDWTAVNGGDYRQLRYLGEMDVAFDRASTRMHRPAHYTLLVEGEFHEAPGPGRLTVVAGDAQPQAAVELILDASGSMLQRMDGKRRINVAKEVLTEAVREHIPAGTPVALRVFGHKEVDACRTDLEIALAPLDPEAATATIAAVNAMNLARTPIADSLAAVEKDLGGARTGVIVLVTDGEETCEGDPEAVIQSLQQKGYDVNLNIVGFAIDNVDLASQFESWAEAGGGRYFGADDQEGLSEAIESALSIPFTVYDQGGNEIATGQVGENPVELERGLYSVVVQTQPPTRFDDVQIRGEDQVLLELE